ncbi:MAG: alpha/beta fold hydrolase [Thermodesulfobacteriota bacterium]|jgi:pimeloyl-ACP methyl ester carboxylesterase
MKGKSLLVVSIILILVGGIVANVVQNDGCKVRVRDVRFAGTEGTMMSALLFIPENATPKTPAPGILAVHGYINTRETQSGFAIEFARRGWVVLELDETGHGYSDPPAFANGYGGPDGLAYLRSLDFVDKNKIGLEGHSMGGWTCLVAAKVRPDDYKSIVLEGSSTGAPFAPEGSTTYPKNMALVFSTHDEFSMLMWGVPIASDVVKSEKLMKVFGVTDTIEPGKVYGSIEDGTARVLYQPNTTHPGDHISCSAIGYAISWFQKTLGQENTLPASNQIWGWKELATLVGLIGGILLLFAAGNLLLQTRCFSSLNGTPQNPKPASGAGWWIGFALLFFIPTLTYFPATFVANVVAKACPIFPQQVSNNILFWMLVNAALSLIFFLIWHFASNKKKGGNGMAYGLKTASGMDWKKIGLSAWFAFLVTAIVYLSVIVISYFFTVDFRFWVIPLKPMSAIQTKIALRYLIPFALFYLMFAVVLHGQMRSLKGGTGKKMVMSMVVAALGYLVMLLVLYIPLLAGGAVPIITDVRMTLYVVVAIQMLPLFVIVSLISSYFYEKTGLIYAGVFTNAMFITWYIVASEATHVAVH